jgi:magnesium-transporting ATPase (P-type)
MAERRAPGTPAGPTAPIVYWRYLAFWVLLFGLLFFISFYGTVADV